MAWQAFLVAAQTAMVLVAILHLESAPGDVDRRPVAGPGAAPGL